MPLNFRFILLITIHILFFSIITPITKAQENKFDLNLDGEVNIKDIIVLIEEIFDINPTPTIVPSPTATWWKPTTEKPIHWHWQLTQNFVYPRDMLPYKTVYDIDGEYTSATTVTQIKNSNPGTIIICYIDAGVWENYRSDAGKFPGSQKYGVPYTGDPQYSDQDIIGSVDVGWGGSYWMDVRRIDILKPIMEARIKNWCKDKGFDAVEPDETEVWSNNSGFNITKAQNNAYNIMIAELAHKYNLSIGLKGNTTEAIDLVEYFDWTLNEECWQYNECKENMTAFLNYRDNNYYKNFGKAVFNIEYKTNPNCTWSNANKMNSAKRDLNLQGPTHNSYLYQPCVQDNVNTW